MTESYDFHNFPALLDRAGINGAEAADLFRVTRTTIYKWMKGKGPHQELLRQFAERQVKVLERAIQLNLLPLKDVPPGERKETLKAVVTAVLKAKV